MPMFGPSSLLINIDFVQIELDTAGDWVKIGSSLWHRTVPTTLDDGTPVVAHQARLDDGTIVNVGFVAV